MDSASAAASNDRPEVATTPLELPVGRYRIAFSGEGRARLPRYSGSAWRGAFGHALKRAVCVTHLPQCRDCLLFRSCVYPYIFETPPPLTARKMRRYTAAPHPFVLQTPPAEAAETDGRIIVGVNLIGHANRHLPYVIYAFERAGEEGIGRDRAPFHLTAVDQDVDLGGHWETIYTPGDRLEPRPPVVPGVPPVPPRLGVRLVTPLRIRRQESLIGAEELSFADLFNVLLRRVSMLTYFHGDRPLETDFRGLVDASRQIDIGRASLRWCDWTRYSSRQQATMQMGGVVGEFELPAAAMEPFWPYLWIGQWTHAGKGASMGLGQYVLNTGSLQNQVADLTSVRMAL
jgi:hypothetical protein